MEEEIKEQIHRQQKLLDEIYVSVKKTQKYFQWTLILSLAVIILPLILFLFMLPNLIKVLGNGLGGF